MKNDDGIETISWAARAAQDARETIDLLKRHVQGDLSQIPPRASLLAGARHEAESMTHAQLLDQYLNTLNALLHTTEMLYHADVYRVGRGIMESERLLKATGIVDKLDGEIRPVRAARKNAGKSTGARKKADAEAWHPKAIEHARSLVSAGRKPSETTAIVAERLGMSTRSVRPILQAAGIVRKKEIR